MMNDKILEREESVRDFNFKRPERLRADNSATYNYAGNSTVDMGREGRFSRKTNINNGEYNNPYASTRVQEREDNTQSRYAQNPYHSYSAPYGEDDSFGEFCDQNPYTAQEQFNSMNFSATRRVNDYHQRNPYFEQTVGVKEFEREIEKPIEREVPKSDFSATQESVVSFDELDSLYSFRRKNLESAKASVNSFRYENQEVDDFAQMPRIESKKKKLHISANANFKLCIAVYVLIVAVIIALVIANVLIGSTAQASVVESGENSSLNYGVVDGQVVELGQSTRNFQYEVEEETNWFDSLISSLDQNS